MLVKKSLIIILLLLVIKSAALAQTTSIKGIVKDAKTGETLIGCNVLIQGTNKGATTDFDGNYEIKNMPSGNYNLVAKYISYNQAIMRAEVKTGKTTEVNFSLEPSNVTIAEVKVTAQRRVDTDLSMISFIKAKQGVVSGISNQQIAKSQDKDASEVIRRIPGITVAEDRFIVVRGLSERYNTVWLNNTVAPSSETDIRAFSFDVIPSGMIDRLLVFKSPAPELPGDFVGGAIQITTKNVPDKDELSISYTSGFRDGTTFNDYYHKKGGKYDFISVDDGTRKLPAILPPDIKQIPQGVSSRAVELQNAIYANEINKNWSNSAGKAPIDHRASVNFSKRINIGKATLGNITSLNYSNTYKTVFKTLSNNSDEYQPQNGLRKQYYLFNDQNYSNATKSSVLHNWSLVFGDNQKLEFRNLFVHNGFDKTTLRAGTNENSSIKSLHYNFMQRNTYMGQLGGNHNFRNDNEKFDWTLGYSYADRFEPDNKRVTYSLDDNGNAETNKNFGKYGINIPAGFPDVKSLGIINMNTVEKNYNISVNYEHVFDNIANSPSIKTGIYTENKNRQFNARFLGFIQGNDYNNNFAFLPLDSIFLEKYMGSKLTLTEATNPSYSYKASNKQFSGYVAFNIPITSKFKIYAGARAENNHLLLSSFDANFTKIPINVSLKQLSLLPSATLTYSFTEKSVSRFSYGKTVNRPEFRELAPFTFYDFENGATVYGDTLLKVATIHNFDLNYSYYPSLSEVLSIGVFYKNFKNPIESKIEGNGNNLAYTHANAVSAVSYGIEAEARKSFSNLTTLGFIRNLGVVFNGSLIESKVQIDNSTQIVKDTKGTTRAMQGQSPYIINAGLFYQNDSIGLQVNLQYNIIGKRIVFVGDGLTPEVYELPRNLLDLSFTQNIGKRIKIKGGVQDLLNSAIIWRQFFDKKEDTNNDGIADTQIKTQQNTLYYKPGPYYTLGFQLTF